jgi:hypothetical protein
MAEIRLNRTEAVDDHLPMVCMYCDHKATVRRTKRFWRSTQAPIFLPGVVVRRGEWVAVDIPFCNRHRNLYFRPLWMMLGGMGGLFVLGFLVFGLIALGMFGGFAAAAGTNNAAAGAAVAVPAMLGGAFLILAALIGLTVGVLVVNFRLIRAIHIDDRTITLCNVSDAFVAAMQRRRDAFQDVDAGDYWKDRARQPLRPTRDVEDLEQVDDDSPTALPAMPASSNVSWYGLVAVIFLCLFAVPCGILSLIMPPAAWALLAYGVAVGLAGMVWLLALAAGDGLFLRCLIPFYAVYYAFARPARALLPLAAQFFGGAMVAVAAILVVLNGGGVFVPPPAAPTALALPDGRHPESPARIEGLLAYWNFDEADGAMAADESGNGFNGAVQGARRVPGAVGQGLYFNGKGDCVDYGRSPRFNFGPGEAFTFAGWVQTRSRNCAIVSQRNSTEEDAAIDLVIRDGQLDWYVRNDRVGWLQHGEVRGLKPINDGQWHHFAGLRTTDGHVELYIDGVLQGQAGGPQVNGPITTDLRFLGTERYWVQVRWYEHPHFEGYLDEVCVYERALKAEEIQALAGR